MEPDYYQILGVEPKADIAIIKAQYRRLVRENHPDIAVDKETAHAKIQQIIAAWSVLSDQTKRADYDERCRRRYEDAAPQLPARSNGRARRSIPHDAKTEARKRERVRQVMGGGKLRRDDNPRTRLLAMFLEAAQLYNVEGRSDDAVRVYQNILRADPTNAEAAVRIGDIYAEQKRRDVALAMYERAVRLKPANADYRRKYNALRHPDGAAPVTASSTPKRGTNPWSRSGPEHPLGDRIARQNPSAPAAQTVLDSELTSDEDDFNQSTPQTSGLEHPTNNETQLSLTEEDNSSSEEKTSFLQRFRSRLKR